MAGAFCCPGKGAGIPAVCGLYAASMIRVRWDVDGVGSGGASAVSMEAVPGVVDRVIAGAVRRHVGGVVAQMLPRMLAPLTRALVADVRQELAESGRWEYRAEGLSIVVTEE